MRYLITLFTLLFAATSFAEEPAQGVYFAKKQYDAHPLPKFEEIKGKLPSPIYDERPEMIDMYWKAWEIMSRNFYEPQPNSGFVTQFVDAAFSANIFQWDTCFITMFCNYGYPLTPGIGSLDNFYARQHADGEICREIVRATGQDSDWWVDHKHLGLSSMWLCTRDINDTALVKYVGREAPQPPPILRLDALDHPIFAWAELEYLKVTGDRSRLPMVYEPLVHYYRAMQKYLRQGNGLYLTDWASMDNATRVPYLQPGGTGVDTSSEMALFGDQLATIADLLGKKEEAAGFRQDAKDVAKAINDKMWSDETKFYYDLTTEQTRVPCKGIQGYWTLLAGVASPEQAEAMVAELNNPNSFKRFDRVPTLAADQKGYEPLGGYWRGAIWAPTNMMVVRGLQRYGKSDLAREIAMTHLDRMATVFKTTGTVWENYAPDSAQSGQLDGRIVGRDFVGWSGLGPIADLLEEAIGLNPDSLKNRLTWTITSTKRCGCERYRFNGHTITLIADGNKITVQSDGEFELVVNRNGKQLTRKIVVGENAFEL